MKNIKQRLPKEGGFTIIEVVLVLAIAALIFLIVFLALPQLQRSRRDTQRKNDAGRVLASLESWAGNNNGSYPDVVVADFVDFVDDYFYIDEGTANTDGLPDLFDPSEGNITFSVNGAALSAGDVPEIAYNDGDCDGGNTGGRTRSVRVALEQGGEYCQDTR